MKEKLYDQIGINYRYFLSWRHASFAGYMVVLGVTASFCIDAYRDAKPLLWLIPLAATPFGVSFWLIDVRIQKIFQAAIQAGRKLEGDLGGYFTEQQKIGTVPLLDKYPRLFTHSAVLRTIYLGSALTLLALSIYLKCEMT